MKKTTTLITISAMALVALIILQVQWLRQSRALIEEQFNQKVSMALCSAVSAMDKDLAGCIAPEPTELLPGGINFENNCQTITTPFSDDRIAFEAALADALAFYDLDTEYEVNYLNKENCELDVSAPNCCALQPFGGGDDQLVQVNFPGKTKYILGQLWFMLISSVLILLFVSLVFLFTNYALLRQKKISEINVDFFNNMAHEFKTPLTNIGLALKLLRKKQPAVGSSQYVQVVETEANKLHQQVERVLYLARMENGKYQLAHEQVDLPDLLQDVVKEMELQLKNLNGKITLDIPKGKWRVQGDAFHLHNAFRNIIDNALKYCETAPVIHIALENTKEGVQIDFRDNGIGINRQDQKRVFQKFQRVGTGNVHNQKGFGLGLAYVKMVMDLHKGFVRIFLRSAKRKSPPTFLTSNG